MDGRRFGAGVDESPALAGGWPGGTKVDSLWFRGRGKCGRGVKGRACFPHIAARKRSNAFDGAEGGRI